MDEVFRYIQMGIYILEISLIIKNMEKVFFIGIVCQIPIKIINILKDTKASGGEDFQMDQEHIQK